MEFISAGDIGRVRRYHTCVITRAAQISRARSPGLGTTIARRHARKSRDVKPPPQCALERCENSKSRMRKRVGKKRKKNTSREKQRPFTSGLWRLDARISKTRAPTHFLGRRTPHLRTRVLTCEQNDSVESVPLSETTATATVTRVRTPSLLLGF